MADEITDVYIATEAGDAGWQSLSALAAEQVDAKLPIESDDGNVKLDGASSVFTVSTGGEERVVVDGSGHVAVNRKDSTSTLPRTNTMLEVVSDATSPFSLILDGKAASGVYEGRSGIRQYGTGGSSAIFEYAIDSTNGTYMFSGGSSARSAITSGESVADILVKPNEYVRLTPKVRTSSVSGLADNDASIKFGVDCQILVGATQSYGLRVRPDGNVAVGGAGAASSRLAIQGSVGGANSCGINNINTFNETVTTGATCFAAKPSFLAPSVGYCILYSSSGLDASLSRVGRLIGYEFTTAGQTLANSVNRAFATDLPAGVGGQTNYAFFSSGTAPSRFVGNIETPSVSGLADSDASVELGADLTVSTGGSQSVIVKDDGRVGFGATPASFVKFQNTGSAATGMRSDITHNSSSRFANSDGQLMVTTAAATADIGVMSGFRISGSTASGATVDQYFGIYVSTVPTGAGIAAGFRTTVNGDGADEGKASFNGFFNVYADGTAPNYFGGEVRITPTAQLNVNKIVGATAPATDASIELGAELLTTNHTPTQPNSIATKQTVDDKIWVGTTAEYISIDPADIKPTTLYCITD